MKRICAERFWKTFIEVWDDQFQAEVRSALLERFSGNKTWTAFMLSRGGFMHTICDRFDLSYQPEWYTVDALFVGGKNLFERGHYPAEVHVLVEHENHDDLETEMWKLLHWRCPLKVLVFYDWSEEEIARRPDRGKWADRRVRRLNEMRQEVNQFWPESGDTEYLFIIGQRKGSDDIVWRRELIRADSRVDIGSNARTPAP